MENISWRLRKVGPDEWMGEVIFGSAPHGMALRAAATGPTKAKALVKAAGLAEQVASNPVVSALLPPQAKLALQAATIIGKSAAAGKAADALAKYTGPGVKRLMKALF
jgi:hypothetical protein